MAAMDTYPTLALIWIWTPYLSVPSTKQEVAVLQMWLEKIKSKGMSFSVVSVFQKTESRSFCLASGIVQDVGSPGKGRLFVRHILSLVNDCPQNAELGAEQKVG